MLLHILKVMVDAWSHRGHCATHHVLKAVFRSDPCVVCYREWVPSGGISVLFRCVPTLESAGM